MSKITQNVTVEKNIISKLKNFVKNSFIPGIIVYNNLFRSLLL